MKKIQTLASLSMALVSFATSPQAIAEIKTQWACKVPLYNYWKFVPRPDDNFIKEEYFSATLTYSPLFVGATIEEAFGRFLKAYENVDACYHVCYYQLPCAELSLLPGARDKFFCSRPVTAKESCFLTQ